LEQDLSHTRREKADAQDELCRAREEINRLREEVGRSRVPEYVDQAYTCSGPCGKEVKHRLFKSLDSDFMLCSDCHVKSDYSQDHPMIAYVIPKKVVEKVIVS
jgi:hypothetical protein